MPDGSELVNLANAPFVGLVLVAMIVMAIGFLQLGMTISRGSQSSARTFDRMLGRMEGRYAVLEKRHNDLANGFIQQSIAVGQLKTQLEDSVRDRDEAIKSAAEWRRLFEAEKSSAQIFAAQIQRLATRIQLLERIMTESGLEIPAAEVEPEPIKAG